MCQYIFLSYHFKKDQYWHEKFVPKVLPAKRKLNFFVIQFSFRIAFYLKFLVIVMTVFFVIRLIDDDENRNRNCRFFKVSFFYLTESSWFDKPIINLKWLVLHQLIRLNLSPLSSNLMNSLTKVKLKFLWNL